MRAALNEAGVGPEEVDHVNAHGLSSRESDEWEARNLQAVFGSSNTPVVAVKSYIGNLGAAGGTTEMAASVLGLHQGEVPRTLNYEEPDPECPVTVTTVSPADDAAVRGQGQLHPDGSVCGRGPAQVGVKDNVQCSVFSVQQRRR